MGRGERIRVGAGATVSAVAVVLLTLSAPASAAPKRITGKLDKRGYTVVALNAGGKAATDRTRRGRFGLRPPARLVTLHLQAKDGTYAGPVVVRSARKGRRAILGVRAGTRLGKVDVRKPRGHSRVTRKLPKRSISAKRRARAKRGAPIGAGNFGRVRSKRTRGGVPGDLDLDGIPDDLDIDDDGDLVLDPVDESPARRRVLSSASAAAAPDDFGVHPILPLLWEDSASSNAGSTDAEIEDDLPTLGRMGIDRLGAGAELDCGGAPDPADPAGWIGGLSYCTRGGSGSVWKAGEGVEHGGGPPFPGPAGGTYDADGDGFGTLDAVSQWELHHGARSRHPAVDPSISQIGSGDVLVQRVTSGGPEGPCGSANTTCFTSTVPFVFATAQTLASWGDRSGESNPVTYPIEPGSDPFPVSDDPADADSNVEVRLTFWRPQRRPASEDECASPAPGCTSGEWIDLGGLIYTAAVLDPPGDSTTVGPRCPPSAYTVSEGEELVPSFTQEDPPVGGLIDQAPDRPAAPVNMFTYELNLTQCLRGTTWSSGEEIGVGFSAETNSTGYTELSGVRFKLE